MIRFAAQAGVEVAVQRLRTGCQARADAARRDLRSDTLACRRPRRRPRRARSPSRHDRPRRTTMPSAPESRSCWTVRAAIALAIGALLMPAAALADRDEDR